MIYKDSDFCILSQKKYVARNTRNSEQLTLSRKPQPETCTTYPATRNYTLHTTHYTLFKRLLT
jgi:hypothetical protein